MRRSTLDRHAAVDGQRGAGHERAFVDQSNGFLSRRGAWYLVIVGGLAVAATLIAPRGLWGFAADRFGWSLLPVGYRVRHPGG